jgi:glycine betaine/choline ABC-type transport system substrate-binding protein
MNDLVSMLSEHNLEVDLASAIINCLLFADDIVLMGKSEQELQTLLNITARLVSKWNFKFQKVKGNGDRQEY